MDIVRERLEREYNLELIATTPTVICRVTLLDGSVHYYDNPSRYPNESKIAFIEEPVMKAMIVCPDEFIGNMMHLINDRRGVMKNMEYIGEKTVLMKCEFPLIEIVIDFYDRLKSLTKGYASFDYEFLEYRKSDLVKLDVIVNKEPVDSLSFILHKSKAREKGKLLAHKLRKLIPRQQFVVPIQAAIGGDIVAREDIPALRKNVIAKCYGGDITRKRKLLEKQKEGKKRMKMVGNVNIPQEAFLVVLSEDN